MNNSSANSHSYIACDLGAESGRVILGTLQNGFLSLEEMHRFSNGPVYVDGSMRWDVPQIFEELKIGLTRAAAHLESQGMRPAESLSADSWAVDYVLVGGAEPQDALPFHYRDSRNEAAYWKALEQVPPEAIFAETGLQFMPFNTLYQLLADREGDPERLAQADQILLIADYFHFLFSGIGRAEISIASTTQFFNPSSNAWSAALLNRFDLPMRLLPPLVASGTVLGPLLPEIAAETGLPEIQVIATCSHDTAAAVAAVPAAGDDEDGGDWAYLSSGTWSLLGVDLLEPLINAEVQAANYTNEIGYGGTVRFLKNIVGLWIVQECRRGWRAEGTHYTYDELMLLASEAGPFRSLINPADARFVKPEAMPEKIVQFCRETGQPVPKTPGQVVRCILESLALSYRQTLHQLQSLTGRSLRRLHIVGGGSQNALLNQFAANAAGIPVLAGPVEATAIGNLLLQAVTLGHLESLAALRQTVRASFTIQTFEPAAADAWQAAAQRFQQLSD